MSEFISFFSKYLKTLKFIDILSDDSYYKNIEVKSNELKDKYTKFVVVGLGGAFIAAKSIIEILKPHQNKVQWIYYLEQDKIDSVLKSVDINKTAFICISKSGETIETLSIIEYLKSKGVENFISLSTFSDNTLLKTTKFKDNIEHLDIESGRYSFTTNVCFLILRLCSINIKKFRKGLQESIKNLSSEIDHESELRNLDLNIIKNFVYFPYDSKFESFNIWICQ